MGQQEHKSEGSVKLAASVAVSEAAGPADIAEISNMVSPPGSKTPPSHPAKRTLYFPPPHGSESQPVDPDTLAKALKEYDDAGRRRERTPGTSPSRKRQRVYGDR
jgi:cell division cycle 20-like protein 1 (cofactor of APC complex)